MTPAPITDALTMEAVAAKLGYSWERFRKVWPKLPGFPPPFKRPRHGHGTYAWRPEAIEAWRLARERAFGEAAVQPDPANDVTVGAAAHRNALVRQRAELGQLMARGR